MADSVTPRKKRVARRPLPLKAVAVSIKTAPQTTLSRGVSNVNMGENIMNEALCSRRKTHIEALIVFPTFQRTIIRPAGYEAIRYPK